MKISVIIPTYKPQDYIWECLDSLERQTLSKEEWEVILILNGCREPWLSDIEQYLNQHNITNIHLIQTDTAGVSNARNIGLDAAQGEYITFIDDDDYISPTYLEELLRHSTPNTVALSNSIAFDENGIIDTFSQAKEYSRCAKYGIQQFYRPKKFFAGPCMKLIHKDIIANRYFDVSLANGEDSLYMFLISDKMKYADFTNKDAIYYRRVRNSSASNSISLFKTITNNFTLMGKFTRIYFSHIGYSFYFYFTRLLACCHGILVKLKQNI